ncbi:MAG: GNAT family N-acetyltransferase [Micropruina sp.]|uniref:GNAT family N-acetyltransferase n=1 Tax=Micropruina sp. TaxID=2737536 RepID=UPI0039E56452
MIEFRAPNRAEMALRQEWLADPEFMSYNAGWAVEFAGYHRDTGCVDFPPEVRGVWYHVWVGGVDRDYWFVEDARQHIVGHAHYRIEIDEDGRRVAEIGASIHPDHRRRGLGLATFAELVRRLKSPGRVDVVRNSFEETRTGAVRIHLALGFRPVDVDAGLDSGRPVTTYELAFGSLSA